LPVRNKAILAARAADEKQATDVLVLAVGPIIYVCDYFVICSASNSQQLRAIVNNIEKTLAEDKVKPLAREGLESSQWMLLDYGDIVIHVFEQEARDYYQLERLWADAEVVAWREEGEVVAAGGE